MASGHGYQRLDSLRGLAALSVGIGHAFLCVGFPQCTGLQDAAVGIFNGDYAVDLFFVLSGFVLADTVRDFNGAHYAAYLGRRLLRLYPPLWAALLFAYVVHATVAAHLPACNALSGWICRLIMPPASGLAAVRTAISLDHHLDPVIWSIEVEIAISMVYPLPLALWIRGGTPGKIAAGACTMLIFMLTHRAIPHFLLLFVAGIALRDIRISNPRHAGAAVGISLVVMAVCGFFAKGHARAADLAAGASAALLIAAIAGKCPRWLAAVLDNRALLGLGGISYSYYLLNPLMLWLIARADAQPLSRLLAAGDDGHAFLAASLLAVCAALASIPVAAAASRLIERPAIAWSRAAERKILRLLGSAPAGRAGDQPPSSASSAKVASQCSPM